MNESPSATGVLKAAGAMGFATFLSRIMGLVREQVFAFLFGAGNFTDAFNVAFRIPNLLRDLFAEGAMSAALVPVFTRTQIEEGDRRAWRVAGLVFRVLFVTVALLAGFGAIFAPQIVELYASAFHHIPGKFELTVSMTRLMFPFFPLVALAAAFMGILNARGVFFLPAFASALFNVTSVSVGFGLTQLFIWKGGAWGIFPIEGMAIGVVVGGMVQAFCQLPMLYRKGYSWLPKTATDFVWYQDPRLRQMLWMMVPGTLGLAATQINLLVNTILATSQGPGAVSWLNYAFRLMQFPIGIFGVSLASATLPQVAAQWTRRDLLGVERTVTSSLRHVFAINMPASVGLIVLGYPIIELIFQYGRFSPIDTHATAQALAMYAGGLTAYSAVKVLVPACYAMSQTKLPVISSILSVVLTISLNLLMVKSCGYWGLALGTSIAALFNAIFLLVSIRFVLRSAGGNLALRPIVKGFAQYLGVSFVMGGVCWAAHELCLNQLTEFPVVLLLGRPGAPLFRAFRLFFEIGIGVGMVWGVAKIFKLAEMNDMADLFIRKLKNKLRGN